MIEELIFQARSLLKQSTDKAHDINHAMRVAQDAKTLAKQLDYPRPELVELCGWWHDVGRLSQNEGHEEISAKLLRDELANLKMNEDSNIVFDAIRFHRWDMTPLTIEGQIVRDADKLDFISPARWDACIKAHQFEHLSDIRALLPKLSSMFYLQESKRLYRERLPDFLSHRYTERF